MSRHDLKAITCGNSMAMPSPWARSWPPSRLCAMACTAPRLGLENTRPAKRLVSIMAVRAVSSGGSAHVLLRLTRISRIASSAHRSPNARWPWRRSGGPDRSISVTPSRLANRRRLSVINAIPLAQSSMRPPPTTTTTTTSHPTTQNRSAPAATPRVRSMGDTSAARSLGMAQTSRARHTSCSQPATGRPGSITRTAFVPPEWGRNTRQADGRRHGTQKAEQRNATIRIPTATA